MNYICVGNYDTPLLQKGKWKEQYSSQKIVEMGTNYIYYGNQDNSCLPNDVLVTKDRQTEEEK